jgi:hypothetical protein
VTLSPTREAVELRRAEQNTAIQRSGDRAARRMRWQCVGLAFAGVPLYLWSWSLTDPRLSELAVSGAFLLSYGGSFARWLVYHLTSAEEFQR